MTTATTTVVFDNTNDTTFRTWGSAISALLASAGLVQTADSGQINWTTVTKVTAQQTSAGYELWRFDDAMQGTTPIFIRIDYGTNNQNQGGNSFGAPGIAMQVGSGSDGAGNITGRTDQNGGWGYTWIPSGTYIDPATPWPSYACHTEGSFFLDFASGGNDFQSVINTVFAVVRTCDTTGVVTGDGYNILMSPPGNYSIYVRTVDASDGTYRDITNVQSPGGGNQWTWMPWGLGFRSTNDSGTPGDFKVFGIYWMPKGTMQPVLALAMAISDIISPGVTFDVALVGTTTHTFISTARHGSFYDCLCFLWE